MSKTTLERSSLASTPRVGLLQGHRQLVEWNATQTAFPATSTLQECFALQVEKRAEDPALIFSGGRWSYRELDQRARHLATRLRQLGIGPERRVGVLIERSPELIMALVAVLQAGGAYVPLDPGLPDERLRFMIEDAGAEVVVSRPDLAERARHAGARVICVDDATSTGALDGDLPLRTDAANLAYVCYTSGSTGRPKGVGVPHRGVLRLLFGSSFARFGPEETCLQLTPVAFDVSVFEIWGTLLHGGRLVLYPPGKVAVSELARFLEETPLTTVWLTGGLFHQMVDQEPTALTRPEQLLAGGEALSAPHVRRILDRRGGRPLINGYGPTECSTFATTCTLTRPTDVDGDIVPIGRPIANTEAYVLDARLRPVAVGEVGELFLGGDGLARCYNERRGLTAERFVPHPFAAGPGARLYQTGDLVSFLPDGRLLFHGRRDHQVKIRGFRIELGEIEAILSDHDEVQEAVLMARPGAAGDQVLVAYLVRRPGSAVAVEELRLFLAERLPEYMVPAVFVFLAELPLNANGKVDRRALPEPGRERPDLAVACTAPRNALEERLSELWQELLGLEGIGVEDPFLALGGHSLLLGRMASRLRLDFGVELTMADLLATPTIAALAERMEARHDDVRHDGASSTAPDIEPAPRDVPLPLSFPQERVWFLYRLAPENVAYNTQATLRLRGPLRRAVFERVLGEIVRRHAIFRTSFPEVDDQPVQVIQEAPPIVLPLVDLGGLDEAAQARETERLERIWFRRPFNLLQVPLVRWAMLRFADHHHLLLQSEHHYVHDGWSLALLLTEMEALYQTFSDGRPAPPEPPTQFVDYAWWQRQWMRGEVLERYLDHWTTQLAGYQDSHELPLDRPRPAEHRFRGSLARLHLDPRLCAALRRVSRQEGFTLFTLMLSAFGTVLYRYSGQDDLLVGSAVANRGRPEIEKMIGMVVNSLVLRLDLAGRPRFRELLARVSETCRQALAYQDMPLDKLVEALEPERDLSRNPLFQTMFSFHDSAVPDLEFSGLRGEVVICHNGSAKTDLNIICIPRAEQRVGRQPKDGEDDIEMLWEYSTDLFDETTIRRLIGHYVQALWSIVAAPGAEVSRLVILRPEEAHQLLREENDTVAEPAAPRSVLASLERAFDQAGDRVAVSFADAQLSCRMLDQRAERLAGVLRQRGVRDGDAVGLAVERGLEMMGALLAIWKAGGFYVPIDPALPAERIAFLVEDSRVRLLLTARAVVERLPRQGPEILVLDAEEAPRRSAVVSRRTAKAGAEAVAYALYTSGSTGRPKGVLISHGALANFLLSMARTPGLAATDRLVAVTTLSFDIAALELYLPLLTGAGLILADRAQAGDGEKLAALLVTECATVMQATPATWRLLIDSGWPRHAPLKVLCGGEALTRELADALRREADEVWNLYGPTETTVWSAACRVGEGSGPVLIGGPLAKTELYVLDDGGQPAPLGVAGELLIGGAGLTLGYLGRPGLSAAKLVPHAFDGGRGARLYRTGDRVRHRPGGGIEFLGRLDFQVKIRGFRIELGEIESVLARHPAVRQAVVMARSTAGEPQLVAYVVKTGPVKIGTEPLRRFVADRLPVYMVPARVVELDAMPLTANGKVDRRALPEPRPDSARAVAVLTPVQEIVAGQWSAVLGLENFGLDDSFFTIGGHSLLATRLLARLRQVFSVDLSLPSLFQHPTVRRLAALIEELTRDTATPRLPELEPVGRDGELPLSFAQQRLWLIEQLEPGLPVYHVPSTLGFAGPLDHAALASSLQEIAHRHEVLRTRLTIHEGRPAQVFEPPSPVSLPLIDLRGLDPEARRAQVEGALAREARRPFDFARGPLWRAMLWRLAEERHVLFFNIHHLVVDAGSMSVLLRELDELYAARLAGRESDLPPLAVQYAEYAVWQRRGLDPEALEAHLDRWRQELGAVPTLELPFDRPRPPRQSFAGERLPIALGEELTAELSELGRAHGATLFITLLAAFQVLLQRYSGQRVFAVGMPVSGRHRVELEPLIGFFVNTLVVRADSGPHMPFVELLASARDRLLAAYAHQDLPFEKLVEELQPERSLSHHPLFQVMLSMQHETPPTLAWGELSTSFAFFYNRTAKFDLTLALNRDGDGLRGTFEYPTDLFDRTTIARLAGHWRTLLQGIVDRPDSRSSVLPLLPVGERMQLLVEWNDTGTAFSQTSVGELFATVARRRSDAVAVVDLGATGLTLSYGELARRAARSARRLVELGVGAEDRVALGLGRSPQAVITILAVLETGAAYVPLDPEYPVPRLRRMLAHCAARLLVVEPRLSELRAASSAGHRVLAGDELLDWTGSDRTDSDRTGTTPSPRRVDPDHLAYVMFTSGSTGEPKAVAVSHRNVVRLVEGANYAHLDADQTFLLLAPLAFDATTFELWGALLSGGRLVLAPPGPQAPPALAKSLRRERVTTLWLTAGLFHQMVEEHLEGLAGVTQLLAGGDVLRRDLVCRVLDRLPGMTLINGYGPTETTTFACCQPLRSAAQVGSSVAIGRALQNARLHVLGPALETVPLGAVGELMIAGDGVARGYVAAPRATAERFVPEPSRHFGQRMYKSGDRVRWLPDRRLEFLGRSDFQVKIRGFRVEPGEIEAVLAEHPRLSQVLVMVRWRTVANGSREPMLVAYAVAASSAPGPAELRDFLGERLPRHMVPAAFVLLDALPLGPTGKVDRNALPAPELTAATDHVAPRDEIEALLAEQWAELLGVERVGVNDGFFELGGHSLLATRLLSRLAAGLGVELDLAAFFAAPTVADQAAATRRALAGQTSTSTSISTSMPRIVPLERQGERSLGFAQERLWFLDQLLPHREAYNISWAWRLRGRLSPAALEAALAVIIARHEPLGSRFPEVAGRPVAEPGDRPAALLPIVDLRGLAAARATAEAWRQREANRPFDLRRGPVLRALLLRLGDAEHELLLSVHHIAADGWSLDVLIDELESAYTTALTGAEQRLPALPVRYSDFVAWQRTWLAEALGAQLAYWRRQLAGASGLLELPLDRPRGRAAGGRGGEVRRLLPAALERSLSALARRRGCTPFMALMTAFEALLARLSGQRDLLVGFPVAGRRQDEQAGLIGFFVNTLVFRGRLARGETLAQALAATRRTLLAALSHQDVPFERLVEELQPERGVSISPLFQVMLTHQSQPVAPPHLPGIVAEPLGTERRAAKFDLTLSCDRTADGLRCIVSYNRELFDAVTIRRWLDQFTNLLAVMVDAAAVESPVAELSLLGAGEAQQTRHEWTASPHPFSGPPTLQESFAGAARRRPEAVAVSCEGRWLSYEQLADRADRLAAELRRHGVGPDVLVGIVSDRSLEMIVGLLGILSAGGAFVPIDPSYPAARKHFMIADALGDDPLLLSRDALRSALPPGRHLSLDRRRGAATATPGPRTTADNLAYVIYTSGSTGRPKGAMNPHRGVVNRLRFMQTLLGLGDDERVLHKAPFSFDVSVWEIFWPLLSGAQLVLARPEGQRDSAYLARLVVGERIGNLQLVPSLLRVMIEEEDLSRAAALRRVVASGEALSQKLQDRFYAGVSAGVSEKIKLYNIYGPTETAIGVLWAVCMAGRSVRLGRPISNNRIYLVDAEGRPVGIGVRGELMIGGAQVGRGYLRRAALTAAAFIPDPFAESPGERLYATGDLARFERDGTVSYLGRRDHQVKIRGLRIELGEIAHQLRRQDGVGDAAAVVRRDEAGEARLVGYAVATPGRRLDVVRLHAALAAALPDFMVPSSIVELAALPLTLSGKLDQAALPEPPQSGPAPATLLPRSPLEELLADLWGELLGCETVGLEDDFFALGGHSLLATRLISRLRALLQLELPLATLFAHPTVAGLAAAIARRQSSGSAILPPISRVADATEPPLSFAQERLWLIEQLAPGTPAYHVAATLRFTGRLDLVALASALAAVARRHEILRSAVVVENGRPTQAVAPDALLPGEVVDLSSLTAARRDREASTWRRRETRRLFELERGPLWRWLVLRFTTERHTLLLTFHHLVIDAWSMSILVRELQELYDAAVRERPASLAPLAVQYADFAAWQRRVFADSVFADDVLAEQLAFWRSELGEEPPRLELHGDRPRPARPSLAGGRSTFELGSRLAEQLEALGRSRAGTLFITLLAAFDVLLLRHTGQKRFNVGVPTAGRQQLEVEGLIGFFVNTLVHGAELASTMSFSELLARTRDRVLAAHAHQDLPFEKLVEALQPERSLSYNPLFQVVFSVQHEAPPTAPWQGLESELELIYNGTAKFDLTLALRRTADGLRGAFEYARDLFDPTTIDRFAARWRRLLQAIVSSPDAAIGELALLPDGERAQLLSEWNDTAPAVEDPRRVQHRFAVQAASAPDRLAVRDPDRQLSYGELGAASGRLARRLQDGFGVGPEVVVAVCCESSVELVVAVLAVLEAGGAYLPLDPDHPAERLRSTVEDAAARVVLTRRERSGIAGSRAPWLMLDELADRSPDARPTASTIEPEHLAYVIYTSGSTGKPKGTALTHRALSRLVSWHQERYAITAADRATQVASPAFDAAVWEIWPYLTAGASLHIPPVETRLSPSELYGYLASAAITCCFLPTPLAVLLLGQPAPDGLALRLLLTGGDTLQRAPSTPLPYRLINHYGPTEATVVASSHEVEAATGTPPIGRPITGLGIFLVDRALEPAPIGVAGELTLGGVSLARGYLARPGLTAERFVPHPFAAEEGERLYRTGDLARHRGDGAIEFLGRLDHQVKVRGLRIELGEIEARLLAHPAVAQAVVTVVQGTAQHELEARLAAYVVAADPQLEVMTLRAFLSEALPSAMVPTAFVVLDALPLTANGKIDRRALPAPRPDQLLARGEHVAPRTPTERLLAELWSELLGVEQPGVDDHFFALGGHSLLAVQLVSRLRSRLGATLVLSDVFTHPHLGDLAAAITAGEDGERPVAEIPRLPRDAELPLSFAQERLWFLAQIEPESTAYNLPLALQLDGELDSAVLAAALGTIERRHEVLRSRIAARRGQPWLRIEPWRAPSLATLDLSGVREPRRELARLRRDEAARPFALDRDPMWRFRLARLAPQRHVLLLTLHHIASDGWSLGVVVRELRELYAAGLAGRPARLPELGVQVVDFAAWQRGWLRGAELERQLAFWRQHLAGAPAWLELPTDRPRPAVLAERGATCALDLDAVCSHHLQQVGATVQATPFMVFLAVLQAVLARFAGQNDVVVGAPIAGRDRLEIEALIGLFLNNLVLRTDFVAFERSGGRSFGDLLQHVARTVGKAYAHQDLPFEKLVEDLQPQRALNRHPLYQVMLNVHQLEDQSRLSLPGLEGRWLPSTGPAAKLDLTIHVSELETGAYRLQWLYSRELFDRTTVMRLAGRFKALLTAALAEPESALHQLSDLPPAERHQLLVGWNDTAVETGAGCLHELFTERAQAVPARLAVQHGEAALSYGELARRSAVLAARLNALGVMPETRVGIHVERSPGMVVAVLGVLRAGGAYVPLDPELPVQRLAQILADSRAAVLLSDDPAATEHLGFAGPSVDPDQLGDGARTFSAKIDDEHLAYVIYTSGTTGRPKGVMCRHQGAVSYLRFMLETFDLRPEDRALQLASLAFDPSVRELFGPLARGATVVLIDAAMRRDPAALLERLAVERIDLLLSVVPSLMRVLPERVADPQRLSPRTLMTNGEQLFLADVRRARGLFGSRLEVINQYGPTECTMVASFHRLPIRDRGAAVETAGSRQVASIGRPISRTRLFVLDARLRPTPVGALGELYIASFDLARGYLDRPAQTAQSFLPDPFTARPGSRFYRSGDLARRLRTGELELVGRRDHQVKVRGNRVELAEIEAALERHPRVSAAVVVASSEAEDLRLVAYVETAVERPPERQELRAFLQEKLPDYMVPSWWVFLAQLPLNANGKLDRAALPAPDPGAEREPVGEAGRTGVEKLLAAIWSELLEHEAVGRQSNFFDLGGHSLHAIRMVYRLQELLGVDLETRLLFEAQTIAQLAPRVEELLLAELAALGDGAVEEQLSVDAAAQPASLDEVAAETWRDAGQLPGTLAEALLELGEKRQALRILRLRQARRAGVAERAIPRRADRQRAPLSWMQETFWLIEQQEAKSVYRSARFYHLRGPLDAVKLERALQVLVDRHEVLRSRFDVDDEGRPYQEIAPRLSVALPCLDLRGLARERGEAIAQRAFDQQADAVFSLDRLPLLRLLLVRLSDEHALLLVVLHHIVSDDWSMGHLFPREVAAIYDALAVGGEDDLEEPAIQFGDYAQWERDAFASGVPERLMSYWSEKMAGGFPQLTLETDRPRPEAPSYRGGALSFAVPAELSAALEARSREANVSLFMTLLAAYKVLLANRSRQQDILVASPSVNRSRIETERLLGCFVNMLMLRTDLAGDPSLSEVLGRVKETALGAFSHQEMPFMVLLANFPPPDFAFDRSPFQAFFTLLNTPGAAAPSSADGLQWTSGGSVFRDATDQDLALWMVRRDRLYGTLIYDRDLFDPSTIADLVAEYTRLLTEIAYRPEKRLSELFTAEIVSVPASGLGFGRG